MHSSRETKITDVIGLCLIPLTALVRMLRMRMPEISENTFLGIVYTVFGVVWIRQLRKRLLSKEERKYLTLAGSFLLLQMLLQTFKFVFLPDYGTGARYIWYLYYFPQVFTVLFMLFAVCCIGRSYDYKIPVYLKLLYIPAAVVVAGILTNDLHQKAFAFAEGLSDWQDTVYRRGSLYYAAVGWMGLCFAAMLTVAFGRCAVSGNRRKIWMPILPLLFDVIYLVSYILIPGNILGYLFKASEVNCFMAMAFMEALILAGLFPSNDNYERLWSISSLGNGIVDLEGCRRYQSDQCIPVTFEQIRRAEREKVTIDENWVLRSHGIAGGFSYWLKNNSEVNHLNAKLQETGDILAEENAMLDGENQIRQKRIRLEQQNTLYSYIARDVGRQIEMIDRCMRELPEDEQAFEQTMKYACVLNAYVKRRSNLLLLCSQSQMIKSEELQLAMMESLEYARLYGIKVYDQYLGKGMLSGDCALIAYQLFEDYLETVYYHLQKQ